MLHIVREAHGCSDLSGLAPDKRLSSFGLVNSDTLARRARNDHRGILVNDHSKLRLLCTSTLLAYSDTLLPYSLEAGQLPQAERFVMASDQILSLGSDIHSMNLILTHCCLL